LQSPRPNNLFIGLYFPVFRRVKFVDSQKIICFLNRQCACEKIPPFFRPGICPAGWDGAPDACGACPDCVRGGVPGNPLSDNKFGNSVIIREFAVKKITTRLLFQ